jgi:hypothetical protein
MTVLRKIEQQWFIVCGAMEIEELTRLEKIEPWMTKKNRHSLFLMIKYPGTKFYRGSWGAEILHFADEGEYRGKVGKIYTNYERYKEIANWFLINTFPP